MEESRVKLGLITVVLLASLTLVAWRQSRALEALAALEAVRQERALAESERADLERQIEYLESGVRVVPAARSRLRMHIPDASEIRILAGDIR
jgi:cell division protein FtsL